MTRLAVAALLLSFHQAQAAPVGATFTSVTAESATASGNASGLLLHPDAGTVVFTDFSADRVVGEIDVSSSTLVVAGGQVTPATTSREPIDSTSVKLDGFTVSNGARIVVLGPIKASLASADGVIAKSLNDLTAVRHATATQTTEVISAAGRPLFEGSGKLLLTGNFTLGLWSVNATLTSSQGQSEILTGFARQPYASVPGVQRGVESTQSREAWFKITNGRIALQVVNGQLSAPNFDLDLRHGAAVLHGAAGQLNVGGQAVGISGDQRLEGGTLHVEAEGSGLGGSFDAPDGATVNGVSLKPYEGSSLATGFALLALLLVLFFVAFAALARWRMHALLAAKEYEGALRWSKRIWSIPGLAEDATVSAAVCFVQLGRLEEAKGTLGAHMWRDRPRPSRLYLRARISAQEGDENMAREYLAECVSLSPSYATDALADAVLGPLLRRHGLGTEAGSYV